MQTNELIQKLSGSLSPRPHKGIGAAFALYVCVTFATMAIGTLFLGPRSDLAQKITSTRFLAESSGIILTFLVAGLGALLLSIPGRLREQKYILLLSFSLALWLGVLVSFGITEKIQNQPLPLDWGYPCTISILALAILPSAVLFFLVRQQAPTRLGWNAFAIATAAFSAGSLALQIHCPVDAVTHHLLWHGLPVLAFGAFSAWWGSKLLKW